jgi:predicted nucleic acid-binding Zn finger protein
MCNVSVGSVTRLGYCHCANFSGRTELGGTDRKTAACTHVLELMWGHAVAQWLRHYATNRKVAG